MPPIAAALQFNQKSGGQMKNKVEEQAANLLSYQNIATRLSEVDAILKRKAEQALFSTDDNVKDVRKDDDENTDEIERKEKIAKELLQKVKKRRKLVRAYSYFTWFCAFFACFLGNLYMKEPQNEHLSSVDASIQNRVVDILPQGSIPGNEQFYFWLDQVVSELFVDPVCGNGLCESPQEYPGFGRFGCIADCGRYTPRNVITVELLPAWLAKGVALDFPDFSAADAELRFSYNIFSETMGAYLFEKEISDSRMTIEVPDGNFRLELFQKKIVSPYMQYTATYASVAPSTMIKPNKTFDFKYGDPAEAIATTALINRQTHVYCSTRSDIERCQRYDPQAAADIIRNMYGLMGQVRLLNGSNVQQLAAIPFCAFKPRDQIDYARIDSSFCASPTNAMQQICLNGTLLAQAFQCKSTYPFSVWSFGPVRNMSVIPPQTAPPRMLTPFNIVIGAIIITQYTRKKNKCPLENSEYIRVLTSQFLCAFDDVVEAPFGLDPTFQSTSLLYDGKLQMTDFYADNELTAATENTSRRFPFAFFPHQWDNGGPKSPTLIFPESYGQYKLFFDMRLTARQSKNLVQYMRDAKFLSNKTQWIELEIITYNADFNLFGILTFQFRWDLGGSTVWNYQYNTALLSPYEGYKGQISLSLDIIFGFMLLADIIRECRDIYHAILRENLLRGYVLKFWNWVEWTQYGLLISCFAYWTVYNQYISSIKFKSSYPVLKNVKASARLFATDAQNEYELLDFTIKMRKLSDLKNFWTAISCVNILIYVMRFLKLLDFQPRMSLITRTLRVASVDLGHYLTLFCIIFVGYATIGTILLGDRLSQFQSFGGACSALFMILMAWEPQAVYRNMRGATNQAKIGATTLTFQIFFWTWVLIATFLMLNIVLAIIVDAFACIKSNLKDAPTISEECIAICKHSAKMLGNRLYGKEWYVSDKEFEKVLLNHDRNFQSRQKYVKSINQIRRSRRRKCVRIAGGVEVTDQDLEGLLESSTCITRRSLFSRAKAMIKRQTTPKRKLRRKSISFTGLKEDGVEIAEDNVYRPPAPIGDLINRYGEFVSEGQDDTEMLQYLEAENMKREMAMYVAQNEILENVELVKDTVESMATFVLPAGDLSKMLDTRDKVKLKSMKQGEEESHAKENCIFEGTLKVTVVAAKRLPKLDLFSESDPYCMLIREEDKHGKISQQKVIACTETRSNDPNPIWNSEHLVSLKCTAETHLLVAVLDRDEHGTDDLIGAIKIAIYDMPVDEELDRWYRLRNDVRPNLTKKALLRLKLLLIPDQPAVPQDDQNESAVPGVASAAGLEGQSDDVLDTPSFLFTFLEVTVIAARNLPKRRSVFSKLSVCDPYIKISMEGIEYESVVRKNTYCPEWGQSFTFQLRGGEYPLTNLLITVMDWNKYSQHDIIGYVEIPTEDIAEILEQASPDYRDEHVFVVTDRKGEVANHHGNQAELALGFRLVTRKLKTGRRAGFGTTMGEHLQRTGSAALININSEIEGGNLTAHSSPTSPGQNEASIAEPLPRPSTYISNRPSTRLQRQAVKNLILEI